MNGTRKPTNLALKIILPLLALLLGIGGFVLMTRMKQPPQRQPPTQQGVLVEISEVQSAPHQVRILATGTVQPKQEIALVPQVSGKVSWLSAKLVNGGSFRKGEKLLSIEPQDYQLAVDRARAELARAEVALRTEQEQGRIARREWQRIELPEKGEPNPLVLREPQLQLQQASLAAARAGLAQAELNLQRTHLYAPFNGQLRNEQVDLGQYLRAGTSIGMLTGSDRVEIAVPLPVEELAWLTIPAAGSQQSGSEARIELRSGGREFSWPGRIVRSTGEVDPASRMASVVVAVDDPYQLHRREEGRPDLAIGLFVEVELLGKRLEDIVSIPRAALRENQQVWLSDADNRLRLRTVHVLRREQRQLLIDLGLQPGERLVLTGLSGAADGMLLRPRLQGSGQ